MLSLDFDEATHVEADKPEDIQKSQRTMFMNDVLQDLAKPRPEAEIWKMSLKMSRPHAYADDIKQFIFFAGYVGVKHLEFNFEDPKFVENGSSLFRLPDAVYQENDNLEYLKLHWCNLDFTRFSSLRFLKTISLGWTIITTSQLRYVVASCPILETLSLKRCVGMNWLWISKPNLMLKNLVLDHCFNSHFLQLQAPKLRMFEYSGKVVQFFLENQIELIEARLDFTMHDTFDRSGVHLFHLMRQLPVRFLTVCSAFLQLIATENLSVYTFLDMNVQHLTMNTSFHTTEFIGIKFMLGSCPWLTTLTLCMVPRKSFGEYEVLFPFIYNPANFWCWNRPAEICLLQSLQVLNVHGFEGSPNEMCLIRYVVYFGRRLQRVNLFLVAVQEDDHAKREELESKCNLLMQCDKGNPHLEFFRG